MAGRVAILLDGAFVTKRLEVQRRVTRSSISTLKKDPADFARAEDVLEYVRALLAHPRLREHELFRIYFYDAPPLEGSQKNPLSKRTYDFSRHPTNALNKRLQDSLAHSADVAVRRGEAVFRGW